MNPRFMATSWAFPYLKDFPFNSSETFKGDGQNTPNLNLSVLPLYLDPIKASLQNQIVTKNIPNWNKSIGDLIASTEVWFVTELEAYSYIPVLNRFSNIVENLQIPLYIGRQKGPLQEKPIIPSSDSLEEESGEYKEKLREWEEEIKSWINSENEIRKKTEIIDPLGCYFPQTGTILIWVDKILKYGQKSQLMFQNVLFHEFIHAALDLQQRDQNGQMCSPRYVVANNWLNKWTEETLDNALVLRAYKATSGYQFIKNFIQNQPNDYALAADTTVVTDQYLEDKLTILISDKIRH